MALMMTTNDRTAKDNCASRVGPLLYLRRSIATMYFYLLCIPKMYHVNEIRYSIIRNAYIFNSLLLLCLTHLIKNYLYRLYNYLRCCTDILENST